MPSQTLEAIKSHLEMLADPERARIQQRFFKTGPGQYGQGDIFQGIRVPDLRAAAGRFSGLSLSAVTRLLNAEIHEHRLVALLLMIRRFEKGGGPARKKIYELYRRHTHRVNSWDLVDTSAPAIAGAYLFEKDRRPLYELARSGTMWERRIAVMATFFFIRREQYADTLGIAAMLLGDSEDLIHKACGWMLREIGKRDRTCAEHFLNRHSRQMPRTMLRYAIERFPPDLRQRYLQGKI